MSRFFDILLSIAGYSLMLVIFLFLLLVTIASFMSIAPWGLFFLTVPCILAVVGFTGKMIFD